MSAENEPKTSPDENDSTSTNSQEKQTQWPLMYISIGPLTEEQTAELNDLIRQWKDYPTPPMHVKAVPAVDQIYLRHKVMGHVKKMEELDLVQYLRPELWEQISKEEYERVINWKPNL